MLVTTIIGKLCCLLNPIVYAFIRECKCFQCLPSCQKATALAAATFSESTPCVIGMRTVTSHA